MTITEDKVKIIATDVTNNIVEKELQEVKGDIKEIPKAIERAGRNISEHLEKSVQLIIKEHIYECREGRKDECDKVVKITLNSNYFEIATKKVIKEFINTPICYGHIKKIISTYNKNLDFYKDVSEANKSNIGNEIISVGRKGLEKWIITLIVSILSLFGGVSFFYIIKNFLK